MLITDRFIVINYPKTGSTFIRTSIKMLHDNLKKIKSSNSFSLNELMLPNNRINGVQTTLNPHGTYEQIPPEYKGKIPCISAIRNPFDRLVSLYKFRSWEVRYNNIIEQVRSDFPEYPNISFERYLDMESIYDNKFRAGFDLLSHEIGLNSFTFIQMFSNNAKKSLREISSDFIDQKKINSHIGDIQFLKSEKLNEDLFKFLLNDGFKEIEVEFILEHKKVFPGKQTRNDNDNWRAYYDNNLFNTIREKELLLLKIFPEYDSF